MDLSFKGNPGPNFTNLGVNTHPGPLRPSFGPKWAKRADYGGPIKGGILPKEKAKVWSGYSPPRVFAEGK